MKKKLSLWVAVCVLIAMLPSNIIFADTIPSDSVGYPDSTENIAYTDYLKRYASYNNADEDITARPDGQGKCILTENQSQIFKVTIDSNHLYALRLTYLPADRFNTDLEVSVKVNGRIPFDAFDTISLKRNWQENNANGGYMSDNSGNEIAPSLVLSEDPISRIISDTEGEYRKPYLIALNEGENQIEITLKRNSAEIIAVELAAPKDNLISYPQYLKEHKGKEYSGKSIIIEGESADLRSDSNLLSQSDPSSPATSPSSPYRKKINTVGGSTWQTAGTWLEWNIDCAEAGYYVFAIKYRQNVNSGMFSTRTLYVNGEIPFKEAKGIPFEYSKKWQSVYLKDENGSPLKIYLNEGVNRIRLEAALGGAAELYQYGKKSVDNLNLAYRQIIMLTGVTPDPLRNYRVDKSCPEAMEILKNEIVRLQKLSKDILAVSGKKGTINTAIDNLKYQLESFAEKPISIPKRIESFRSNITAFADSVYSLKIAPLEIDYLVLSSSEKDEAITDIEVSFIKRAQYTVLSFISSFSENYNLKNSEEKDTISVWVTTGRDQATVMKQLCDTDFTKSTEINVDVKMVSNATGVSTLLLATVSGFGPDVAVGLPNSEAVNYAIRKSAVDVSGFSDFNSVKSRFTESALTPMMYDNGCYGVPLTQGFLEMFCRDDILKELGLSPPKTWDDLYITIGELQKKNMTVGIPADLTCFSTMIFQNGRELYTKNKTKSLFNESVPMREFSKLCELYTGYNIPIDYDGANRFRTGEMPIVIADYSFYNTISVLAPEIKGNWSFYNIPGVLSDNGEINHTSASTGSCAMILSESKRKESAWKFVSWLTDDSAQSSFANLLESRLGVAARWQTANINASRNIAWTSEEYETIESQRTSSKGIEEIAGSYYVARNINNAIRNVVSYHNDPREVLNEYTIQINDEITNKRKQYNLD